MSNMGYCRFRNTLEDLHDCNSHMDDELDSEDEVKARRKLIDLCQEIANDYYDEAEL